MMQQCNVGVEQLERFCGVPSFTANHSQTSSSWFSFAGYFEDEVEAAKAYDRSVATCQRESF